MSLNPETLNAILSMDSYNRGYDQGIDLPTVLNSSTIGNSTIKAQSDIDENSEERQVGFYAVAYDTNGDGNSDIISYRGTNDPVNGIWSLLGSQDVWNGWTAGAGSIPTDAAQAEMAIEFYKSIAGTGNYLSSDITLTGHSLGGGLAGLVGNIYGQKSDVHDAMPFLYALGNTIEEIEGGNLDLQNLIFGTQTPWVISENHANINALTSGSYIFGEVLQVARNLVSPTQPEFQSENSLYQERYLGAYAQDIQELSNVELHSPSTIVIDIFGDTELAGNSDWHNAAKYFWPALYDASFAENNLSTNLSKISGSLLTTAQAGETEKYADILRMIIAYSAIDEGERPFGDTAIRALYDDANNLGAAITLAGAGSMVEEFATDISKLFVHFAGQLALNDVEQLAVPGALAANGVLMMDVGSNSLSLNTSVDHWTLMNGVASHNLDATKNDLINALWAWERGNANIYLRPSRSVAANSEIGGISFSTDEGSINLSSLHGSIGSDAVLHAGSAGDDQILGILNNKNIIFGGEGHDGLIGGSQADYLSGNAGDDVLSGGDGDDVIFGGSGDDTISGGLGDDFIHGGSGYDTVDLSGEDKQYFIQGLTNYQSADGTDAGVASFVEHIIFGRGDDYAYTYSSTSGSLFSAGITDLGEGFDTFSNRKEATVKSDGIYTSLDRIVQGAEEIDNRGHLFIESLGNHYTVDPNGVFDYSGYSQGLDIDFLSGTVSDGSSTDTFDISFRKPVIVGTNNGDTIAPTRDAEIWTGLGDDQILLNTNAADRGVSVIYQGGNDVLHHQANNNSDFAVTFGPSIDHTQVSLTQENVQLFTNPDSPTYGYEIDLKINVAGHGSITITDIRGTMHEGDDGIRRTADDYAPFGSVNRPDIGFFTGGSIVIHGLDQYVIAPPSTYETQYGSSNDNVVTIDGFYYGRSGNDIITGGDGRDTLYGQSGNDTILGGAEQDYIEGGSGNDLLYGGDGGDIIHGGYGDDEIYGDGAGNAVWDKNILSGGYGNDKIYGGSGYNLISGGFGDDEIFLYDGQSENYVDAGLGNDTIRYNENYEDYTITIDENYTASISFGAFQISSVSDVEVFQFSNVTKTFDEIFHDTNGYYPGGSSGGSSNTAPVAQDDSFVGDENVVLSGNVLGNDSDPDGDPISVSPQNFVTAQGGSVSILANGDFTYTPAADFSGADSFTYTLSDDGGLSDTASVNLTINPATGLEPPRAAETVIHLGEAEISNTLADSVQINTGDYLQKTHAIAFETGADVTTRQVIYEQGGGSRGLNMFIEGGKLYAAVWNKAEENWGYKELEADVLANQRYTAVLSMDGALPSNGSISLSVNGSVVGSDSGIGQLYGHGDNIGIGEVNGSSVFHNSSSNAQSSFTGTIEKLVQYNAVLDAADASQLDDYLADGWLPDVPLNTAPVAQDDSFVGDEDMDLSGNVLGNDSDADGDALSVTAGTLTTTQGGSVILSVNGDFTYTPVTDFFGADSFVYTVSDGNGGTDTATVNLTINDVAEPPVSTEAPTTNLALLEDGGVSFGSRPDDANINLSSTTQKIQAISFETGADVTTRQVLYEQGGGSRGLNMFIDGGKLYAAVWNKGEENWGYKELSHDITADTKYTATLVVDGSLPSNGLATLYVDGAPVSSALGVGNLYAHSDDIGVGQIAGSTLVHNAKVTSSTAFTGTIEKLAHYDGGLSAAEMDQLQDYLADGWLIESPPAPSEIVVMEFGSVDADHTGATVSLTHSFNDPVVFATMTSFNDGEVAVARITDIQDDSFTLYAQEAEYLDSVHAVESFSYIVIEKGSWILSDGTKLEVGTIDTNLLAKNGFEAISFGSDFDATPATFTQVQSNNDPVFVAMRQDNATQTGFDLALTEEELTNSGSHGSETVGWFAIEQGAGNDDGFDFFAEVGGDNFTHNWQDIMFDDQLDQLPQLLASISTHDGGDASFIRADAVALNSVSVQVQEDQSKDTEINHTSERVDVFAIEGSGQLTGLDNTDAII